MEKTPKSNLDLGSGSAWRSVPSATSLEPTLTSLMLPGIPGWPPALQEGRGPKDNSFSCQEFCFLGGKWPRRCGKDTTIWDTHFKETRLLTAKNSCDFPSLLYCHEGTCDYSRFCCCVLAASEGWSEWQP